MGLFLDSQLCVINLYVCCYASTTLFWLLQLWGKFFYYSNSEIYFYFIYFFVLLYNTVSVLLYIDMNPPWVYMSSQSWTPLPPRSLYHLSGLSQCTSPKNPVSCIEPRLAIRSLVAQRLKPLSPMRETRVWSLGQEDPLEKEMVTCSSILAWRIPWKEEPGRLQSMGSQRVRHNWVTKHTPRWPHLKQNELIGYNLLRLVKQMIVLNFWLRFEF